MSKQWETMAQEAITDALEWKTRARNAEYACREAYRLLVDQDTAMPVRDLETLLLNVLKKAGKA